MRIPGPLAVAILLSGTIGVASVAHAEPMVKVSCTQAGRLVYMEEIPSTTSEERRMRIAESHPDAMCVFMNGTVPRPGPSEDDEDRFDYATLGDSTDPGLVAALEAITGTWGDEGKGIRRPSSRTSANEAVAAPNRRSVPAGESVGLVVGVYEGVAVDDVLAHWRASAEESALLAKFTPTVSTGDDVVILALDGLQDSEIEEACKEADRTGLACIAAY